MNLRFLKYVSLPVICPAYGNRMGIYYGKARIFDSEMIGFTSLETGVCALCQESDPVSRKESLHSLHSPPPIQIKLPEQWFIYSQQRSLVKMLKISQLHKLKKTTTLILCTGDLLKCHKPLSAFQHKTSRSSKWVKPLRADTAKANASASACGWRRRCTGEKSPRTLALGMTAS